MSKELIQAAINHMIASPAYERETMSADKLWDMVCFNHYTFSEYNFTIVDQSGHPEDSCKLYVVVSVDIPDHGNVLLRMDGVYDSWDDNNFQEEPYLVQPVEVTKIEYQRIV